MAAGSRIECSNMALTMETENPSRKKVKASQPESITYMVRNKGEPSRALIQRKPTGNRNMKVAVPSTPKLKLKETKECRAPTGLKK
jgi:hypothetical protein